MRRLQVREKGEFGGATLEMGSKITGSRGRTRQIHREKIVKHRFPVGLQRHQQARNLFLDCHIVLEYGLVGRWAGGGKR